MPPRKIIKLRFDSWGRYETFQGKTYNILPIYLNQLVSGDLAKSIQTRIETSSCPNCGSSFRIEEQHPGARRDYTGTRLYYHLCDSCGFWNFEVRDDAHWPSYTIPHIKRFDYETSIASLSHLSKEMHQSQQKVYDMDPTKFEVFVGSVVSDFLDCEVHHVGRSGDDGVDLIALVGESPLMIQVKRRQDPTSTEGIDVVKLLFTSAFARGADRGMVITSAKQFTRPARLWSESRKIVESGFKLKLVDINSLMSMINAVASKDAEPAWHRHRDRESCEPRIGDGLNSHAHELLHFSDFDAVAIDKDDATFIAFEHADLTKIYSMKRKSVESYLRNSDLRFAEIRDKTAPLILHDEPAIQIAERLPFGTKNALRQRWTNTFPDELFDLD
jgi:hypothetical protein